MATPSDAVAQTQAFDDAHSDALLPPLPSAAHRHGDSSSYVHSARSMTMVLLDQCRVVMAAMRLNQRFAGAASHQHCPALLRSFHLLTSTVRSHTNLLMMDATTYLTPFLNVIHSESTSGPITGAALCAIHTFLAAGFLDENSPGAPFAMMSIADTVNHCRFEATDPDSDEVVLMRIVRVLLECVRCPAGSLLSDDLLFEMLQTCFRMSLQSRLSMLLRRTAEDALAEMVTQVFVVRGHALLRKWREHGDGEERKAYSSEGEGATSEAASAGARESAALSTSVSLPAVIGTEPHRAVAARDRFMMSASGSSLGSSTGSTSEFVNPQGIRFAKPPSTSTPTPYGMRALYRAYRFFCECIDPEAASAVGYGSAVNEVCKGGLPIESRLMTLNMIRVIVTSSSGVIRHPLLRKVTITTLCKNICKNLNSSDLSVVTLAMRIFLDVVTVLGASSRELRVALEVFISNVLRIGSEPETPYAHQEATVEHIVDLLQHSKDFVPQMFVYFDCDVRRRDVFEEICKFLYQNSYPHNGTLYTVHMASLEGLLGIVSGMKMRWDALARKSSTSSSHHGAVSRDESISTPRRVRRLDEIEAGAAKLSARKQYKKKLLEAVHIFNRKPKDILPFLIENELISREDTEEVYKSFALFLRLLPQLDKKQLGLMLGRPGDDAERELRAFLDLFDFETSSFVSILRQVLTSFLIPGESQVIARVLEIFANMYCTKKRNNEFANEDVAYILAYSIVLLNVDHYNASVKNKMTKEQYLSSVRGINDQDDLPHDMLCSIFDNITSNEIQIPELDMRLPVSDASWHFWLTKEADAAFVEQKLLDMSERTSLQSHLILPLEVGPGSGDEVVEQVACDREVFLVMCRSTVAALSVVFETSFEEHVVHRTLQGFEDCASMASHFHLPDVLDNAIITLCKFSGLQRGANVRTFGASEKYRLATKKMFEIVHCNGDHMRESWHNILHAVVAIHEMGLVMDEEVLFIHDGQDTHPLPSTPSVTRKPIQKSAQETSASSLLSAFGSWFSGTADTEDDGPEEHDVVAEAAAKECIAAVRLRDLILLSANLQADSLVYFIKALIYGSHRGGAKATSAFGETSAIFCLEMLTTVTLLNQDRIIFVWVLVYEHFRAIIQGAEHPSLYVEKAIICLLLLCVKLLAKNEIRARILRALGVFVHLKPAVADAMSETVAVGVANMVKSHAQAISEASGWKTIFALLRFCADQSQAARARGFGALRELLLGSAAAGRPVGGSPVAMKTTEGTDTTVLDAVLGQAFVPCLETLLATATTGVRRRQYSKADSDMSVECMRCIMVMMDRIPHLMRCVDEDDTSAKDPWEQYYFPVLSSLQVLCCDPRHAVRHHAMNFLQRSLLSPELSEHCPNAFQMSFPQIIFPLLTKLLKPMTLVGEDKQVASMNIEETRVRATTLLSRIFLQHLARLVVLPTFHTNFWFQMLKYFEMYRQTDHGGFLAEAIPETLKNILLVMVSSRAFIDAESGEGAKVQGREVWAWSWEILDRFCPSLKEDESFCASLATFDLDPRQLTQSAAPPASRIESQSAPELQAVHATKPRGEASTPSLGRSASSGSDTNGAAGGTRVANGLAMDI